MLHTLLIAGGFLVVAVIAFEFGRAAESQAKGARDARVYAERDELP